MVLDLPEDAKVIFEKYELDLPDIFVVSSVSLKGPIDGPWAYQADFEVPGGVGVAWILPPRNNKCPRCWRWLAPVEAEGLCGRCEGVVGPQLGKGKTGLSGVERNELSKGWK